MILGRDQIDSEVVKRSIETCFASVKTLPTPGTGKPGAILPHFPYPFLGAHSLSGCRLLCSFWRPWVSGFLCVSACVFHGGGASCCVVSVPSLSLIVSFPLSLVPGHLHVSFLLPAVSSSLLSLSESSLPAQAGGGGSSKPGMTDPSPSPTPSVPRWRLLRPG